MCGICCVLGDTNHVAVSNQHYIHKNSRLYNRGPDSQRRVELSAPGGQTLVMCGSVLGLRGHLTPQPLTDTFGNTLLWNGEIFGGLQVEEGINDTEVLLTELSKCHSPEETLEVICNIQGPFSIIYWQVTKNTLWFGRDVLGRRSLLWHFPNDPDDVFILSSVRVHQQEFKEIPAVGIFSLTLKDDANGEVLQHLSLFPWTLKISANDDKCFVAEEMKTHLSTSVSTSGIEFGISQIGIQSPISAINLGIPREVSNLSLQGHEPVDFLKSLLEKDDVLEKLTLQLIDVLQRAVSTRVSNLPKPQRWKNNYSENSTNEKNIPAPCKAESVSVTNGSASKSCCGSDEPVRNVANQRSLDYGVKIVSGIPDQLQNCQDCPSEATASNIHSCVEDKKARIAILFSGGLDSTVIAALADRCLPEDEPIDLLNVAFEQRQKEQFRKNNTHKKSSSAATHLKDPFLVPDRRTGLTALSELNPRRKWNFVEINVTLEELRHQRQECVAELLYPLHTVLDDSIGCAVWFAARGQGEVRLGQEKYPYSSNAKVILVGMGADEQLAGYSRHRTKFQENGWEGLADEIKMEVDRISTRNLGRDDRIITDHGKESRLPFLDENVVSFLNQIPVHQKADLTLPRGVGEKLLLRLCAVKLGLLMTAVAPKRAIQFGSRIAKSENRKEHASDKCNRLMPDT